MIRSLPAGDRPPWSCDPDSMRVAEAGDGGLPAGFFDQSCFPIKLSAPGWGRGEGYVGWELLQRCCWMERAHGRPAKATVKVVARACPEAPRATSPSLTTFPSVDSLLEEFLMSLRTGVSARWKPAAGPRLLHIVLQENDMLYILFCARTVSCRMCSRSGYN